MCDIAHISPLRYRFVNLALHKSWKLVYRDGIEDMGSSGVMEERFNIFICQNLHVIGT
jgi:hypothetical protein